MESVAIIILTQSFYLSYYSVVEEEGRLQVLTENLGESEMAIPGAVLDAIQTRSGWRAMTNPIIMEKIADFLSDKDLVCLCLTSKITKKIVDQMDSSCWRKRAQKLEAVLRLHTPATDSTPYKERYLLLIPEVERLANRIRGMIEDNSGIIDVDPDYLYTDDDCELMSLQDLANTASLVHYDMVGEVSIQFLQLWSGDLSSIPPYHLGSLAACVTDQVFIGRNLTIHDLGVLLDKVKSENIFIDKNLETDVTLAALVQAMQTRVKTVFLIDDAVVCKTLLKTYGGKGKCEEIRVEMLDSIETHEEDMMRQLAQTIDWDVDVTVTVEQSDPFETEIIFKRK